MTWQERPSSVLRAGTPGAVRWLQGSPAVREELTDTGGSCEAGAGSATCPDCACAAGGWQAVPVRASLRLSPLGCCLPARRFRPHRPDFQALAPRPGSHRRRARENAAPCLGLPAPPSLYPAFSPKSLAPSLRFQQSSFNSRLGAAADANQPLPTPINIVVMSQPGIPASGGAPIGLQAQNGAARASGSPYTNGKSRPGVGGGDGGGAGDGKVWAPARADLWLLPPSEGRVTSLPGSGTAGGGRLSHGHRGSSLFFIFIYLFFRSAHSRWALGVCNALGIHGWRIQIRSVLQNWHTRLIVSVYVPFPSSPLHPCLLESRVWGLIHFGPVGPAVTWGSYSVWICGDEWMIVPWRDLLRACFISPWTFPELYLGPLVQFFSFRRGGSPVWFPEVFTSLGRRLDTSLWTSDQSVHVAL